MFTCIHKPFPGWTTETSPETGSVEFKCQRVQKDLDLFAKFQALTQGLQVMSLTTLGSFTSC